MDGVHNAGDDVAVLQKILTKAFAGDVCTDETSLVFDFVCTIRAAVRMAACMLPESTAPPLARSNAVP